MVFPLLKRWWEERREERREEWWEEWREEWWEEWREERWEERWEKRWEKRWEVRGEVRWEVRRKIRWEKWALPSIIYIRIHRCQSTCSWSLDCYVAELSFYISRNIGDCSNTKTSCCNRRVSSAVFSVQLR